MIHYHGTPCGGPRQEVARFLAGRHALVPFPRAEDLPVVADVCQSFVIDNGAFTIWKQGGTLDVQGYLDFVGEWRTHPAFDWALIPDVIDGTEQDNDRLMSQWPFPGDGVPVWHFHESVGRLARLCGAFSTVALGSSGKWATPGTEGWWNRLAEVFPRIMDADGRPICKLHGLRMLNPEIFMRVPFHSADSTNAVRNASNFSRFGNYLPPTHSQRLATIADRIEAHQSAACWTKKMDSELWQLCQ